MAPIPLVFDVGEAFCSVGGFPEGLAPLGVLGVVGCRFGEGRLGWLVCRLYSEFVHLVQVNAKGV